MEKRHVWEIYFAGICSIQFHPANHILFDEELENKTLRRCVTIADKMLLEDEIRWTGLQNFP